MTLKTTLQVTTQGEPFAKGTIPVDDLLALLRPLQSALARAALVPMGAGAIRPGRPPKTVEEAARLQLVALRPGSAVLELEVDRSQADWVIAQLGQAATKAVVEGIAALQEDRRHRRVGIMAQPPQPVNWACYSGVERSASNLAWSFLFWEPLDTGDPARAMNVRRAGRLEEWTTPIQESEDEQEEFLSDIYGSRRAGQEAWGGLRHRSRHARASMALLAKQSRRRGSRHG